mmetsp:Transcript_4868/g.12412  ORF Transcript_4868/g.12412 Transcript_4868/m.12412 type:complete len:699 (+) Transcript_4868:627-2723(+)
MDAIGPSRALNPGHDVHRVAVEAELGVQGAHDRADRGPGVDTDSDAHVGRAPGPLVGDRGVPRGLEGLLREGHDPGAVVAVVLVEHAPDREVGVADRLDLVQVVLGHQPVQLVVELVEEARYGFGAEPLRELGVAHDVAHQEGERLVGVGARGPTELDVLGHLRRQVGAHDVPRWDDVRRLLHLVRLGQDLLLNFGKGGPLVRVGVQALPDERDGEGRGLLGHHQLHVRHRQLALGVDLDEEHPKAVHVGLGGVAVAPKDLWGRPGPPGAGVDEPLLAREAEVADLGRETIVHEDVGGPQVVVHHRWLEVVEVRHSRGDVLDDAEDGLVVHDEGRVGQAVDQAAPAHALHHQHVVVGQGVLGHAHDGHDVRVPQLHQQSDLVLKVLLQPPFLPALGEQLLPGVPGPGVPGADRGLPGVGRRGGDAVEVEGARAAGGHRGDRVPHRHCDGVGLLAVRVHVLHKGGVARLDLLGLLVPLHVGDGAAALRLVGGELVAAVEHRLGAPLGPRAPRGRGQDELGRHGKAVVGAAQDVPELAPPDDLRGVVELQVVEGDVQVAQLALVEDDGEHGRRDGHRRQGRRDAGEHGNHLALLLLDLRGVQHGPEGLLHVRRRGQAGVRQLAGGVLYGGHVELLGRVVVHQDQAVDDDGGGLLWLGVPQGHPVVDREVVDAAAAVLVPVRAQLLVDGGPVALLELRLEG